MFAKKVFESINFTHGGDPYDKLKIGSHKPINTIKELYDFLKNKGYEVNQYSPDEMEITNKHDNVLVIRFEESGKFICYVGGYKRDIQHVFEDLTVGNVEDEINIIDQDWIEENDPDADLWF